MGATAGSTIRTTGDRSLTATKIRRGASTDRAATLQGEPNAGTTAARRIARRPVMRGIIADRRTVPATAMRAAIATRAAIAMRAAIATRAAIADSPAARTKWATAVST